MRHLIVSREYPPATYAAGGIGTYAENIARLLAERGETVHVIAERWSGAPKARETLVDGRLVVHRIGGNDLPAHPQGAAARRLQRELDGLKATAFPSQWFAWHAAFLAEQLAADEGIDVIEAQEWEAPLYYLLLRRAIGIAEAPSPPCIVHLHSATAFIRHYNGAVRATRGEQLMERMEDFCIRSADALLCPSRYYARQCVDHFALEEDSVDVIPLPVGITPAIERDPSVWANGSICFVGRIEPRKGVVEWITAAARVAAENRDLRFEFVGADQLGLRRALEARIAPELRSQFRFHGSQPREALPRYLAAARAAVVPSRWENFPNVCIEAMGSGLPVIATRVGGMVELLEDGRTGWLTGNGGVSGMVDGLAEALRRCVATPPEELARMGLAANRAVTRICDNDKVVGAHLAFRTRVAEHGASRSLHGGTPTSGRPLGSCRGGVVVQVASPADARPVLTALSEQSVRPAATVLVCTGKDDGSAKQSFGPGVTTLRSDAAGASGAWNHGLSACRSSEIDYWMFLDGLDTLEPSLLERVGRIFERHPEVGIVVPWTLRPRGRPTLEAPPCADLTHQLIDNDVTRASAFRAEALRDGSPFTSTMPGEYGLWRLANAVLLDGWAAVTLPEALALRNEELSTIEWPETTALRAVRAEVLEGVAGTISRATLDLVEEYVPLPGAGGVVPPHPSGTRRYLAAIAEPRRLVRALRARVRR